MVGDGKIGPGEKPEEQVGPEFYASFERLLQRSTGTPVLQKNNSGKGQRGDLGQRGHKGSIVVQREHTDRKGRRVTTF